MANPSGNVAVVTGASSGIGEETAVLLAQRGFNVLINYNSSHERAEAVAGRCKEYGVAAITEQGDVSQAAACEKLVEAAVSAWGRLDVVVNNAGTTKGADYADFEALDQADFLRIYHTNVVGPCAGTYDS
eukprot:SAG31_NODE_190_length_20810_cov_20.296364_1_plen_130_part_00